MIYKTHEYNEALPQIRWIIRYRPGQLVLIGLTFIRVPSRLV